MNTPLSFRVAGGEAVDIDPMTAMFNSAWAPEAIRTTLAARAG
jgi:hypothetical protein